jgi:hypothetical protein
MEHGHEQDKAEGTLRVVSGSDRGLTQHRTYESLYQHNYFRDILPLLEYLPMAVIAKPRSIGFTTRMVDYIAYKVLTSAAKVTIFTETELFMDTIRTMFDRFEFKELELNGYLLILFKSGASIRFVPLDGYPDGYEMTEASDITFFDEMYDQPDFGFIQSVRGMSKKLIISTSFKASDWCYHDFNEYKFRIRLLDADAAARAERLKGREYATQQAWHAYFKD